jgi:hypothetical protein
VTYVTVPYQKWESVGESPLRTTAIIKAPYPEGEGVGGGASLVPSLSITDTPSKICEAALTKLEALSFDRPQKKYEGLCQEFFEYLDMCEQKKFILKGYDVKKGKFRIAPIDYDNRWGPNRRRELGWKLDRLESWFSLQVDRPVVMITLTSYQEGLTISQAWGNLNKSRTKLLKMIRKHCGDVDYFWVTEPHKSGYVHYHLAVFCEISIELENTLRHLWSTKYKQGSHTYGLDFSRKKGDDKLKSLKDYLSKYLRKGFLLDQWTIGMLLFNAHLWSTGFRMYGGSKRISSIMKLPEDPDLDIVWLETTYQDVERTPEGGLIDTERVIWARQYIPDWIDTDIWCYDREPDDSVKLCDWGRGPHQGYDPTHGKVTNL